MLKTTIISEGPVHPSSVLFCSPHIELADDVIIQELGKIHKVDLVGKSVVAISRREGAEEHPPLKVVSQVEQLLEEESKLAKLDRPWVKRPICIITTIAAAQPVQLSLGGVPADPPEVQQVPRTGGQPQLVDVAHPKVPAAHSLHLTP